MPIDTFAVASDVLHNFDVVTCNSDLPDCEIAGNEIAPLGKRLLSSIPGQ